MDGKTIRLLSEYIAEHHRRERQRESITYNTVYDTSITDTNGVEKDWEEPVETFWPPENNVNTK